MENKPKDSGLSLKKLEQFLNDNKEKVFDGKYLKFELDPIIHTSIFFTVEYWGTITGKISLSDILFNHSVAKCAYGKKSNTKNIEGAIWSDVKCLNFEHHLMEMVLLPTDEERLDYFVKDLGEEVDLNA